MPRRQRVNPRGPSMKRFGVTEVRHCRIAINTSDRPWSGTVIVGPTISITSAVQIVVTPCERNSWTNAEKKGSIGLARRAFLKPQRPSISRRLTFQQTLDLSAFDIAKHPVGEFVKKLIGRCLP